MKRYKKEFNIYTNLDFSIEDLFRMTEGHMDWSDGICLFEAVINVNPELQEIKKLLLDIKSKFYKLDNNLNSIELFFENLFLNRKIFLKHVSLNSPTVFIKGAKYYEPNNEIYIYFTDAILGIIKNKSDIDYLDFIEELCGSIGHELIHRGQSIRIEYEQIRDRVWNSIAQTTLSDFDKRGRTLTPEKKYKNYLSINQEIMAHAWKIVNNFRLCGINDNYIKKFLSKNSRETSELGGPILKDYLTLFLPSENNGNEYKDVLKKLYKYMYSYLSY